MWCRASGRAGGAVTPARPAGRSAGCGRAHSTCTCGPHPSTAHCPPGGTQLQRQPAGAPGGPGHQRWRPCTPSCGVPARSATLSLCCVRFDLMHHHPCPPSFSPSSPANRSSWPELACLQPQIHHGMHALHSKLARAVGCRISSS